MNFATLLKFNAARSVCATRSNSRPVGFASAHSTLRAPTGFAGVLLGTCCSVAVAFVAPPASAQDTGTGNGKIEEIIVTANRRQAQNVQDVPVTISVVTQEKIEIAGMDNFLDYARTIPGIGFHISSSAGGRGDLLGGRRVAIRGIESGVDGIPTTAFYLNNAAVPIMDPKLFDIRRIEVLRGPQGTLYGANSMGGTIRVVLNKPVLNQFDYKVDTTLATTPGTTDEIWRANAMLNTPLIEDTLALRGVMSYRDEGGYIDNVRRTDLAASEVATEKGINDESTWGGRLELLWAPTDRLEIRPSIFRQELQIDDTPVFQEGFRDLSYFNKLVSERQVNNFTLYALEVSYNLGSWQITSSTNFFESDFRSVDDFTVPFFGIPLVPGTGARGLQDIRSERTSQELHVSYTGGTGWDGIFGVLVMKEDRHFRQDLPNDGNVPSIPPPAVIFTGTEENSDDRFAVFGEVNFELTDRLSVTTGVRWFKSEQAKLTVFDGVINGGLAVVEGQSSGSAISPKLQVSYDLTGDSMIYGVAAKGFRPGGPTNLVPPACEEDLLELGLSEPLSEFDADTLWSYEVGVKSTLADNRIVLNAATYFIDWQDVQQSVRLDCGFGFVGNVGAAESKGFELEVTAAPTERWSLFASFGYTGAEFTKTSREVGVVAGDRIPNVPELTGSASAQYTFPLMNGHEAYLRGDYQYVDKVVADDQSPERGLQFRPSYQLFNARLGVMLTEHLEFALFVDNVLDERPILTINSNSDLTIPRQFTTSRPRTIGIKFSYSAMGQ